MLPRHQDPIVAVATAPGRGALGIVRISGEHLKLLFPGIVGVAYAGTIEPRHAKHLKFLDAQGRVMDQGLLLYFPSPHSATGEDVVELHAHGGPVVLQMLVARVIEAAQEAPGLARMRVARPGEFTERAFLNDKLDLAQAEAVADLIDASTQVAARGAARSLTGVFSDAVNSLRDALIDLRMRVEAMLDFPEEEIEHLSQFKVQEQLAQVRKAALDLQAKTTQGALLREGIKVVIAGPPNAGKSSLLNALVGAERAIVTPIAGTTRDKVQETISIEGVPIHIIDTAGLRQSDDVVERIGIEKAWQEIAQADCVIHLHDLAAEQSLNTEIAAQAKAMREQLDRAIQNALPQSTPVLQVWNKADLTPSVSAVSGLLISAKTGAGLDGLRAHILRCAGWQQSHGEGLYIARARHVQALARAQAHLESAGEHLQNSLRDGGGLDLLAEELRLAHNALGELTGQFSSDDLLGEIFSRFCIGK